VSNFERDNAHGGRFNPSRDQIKAAEAGDEPRVTCVLTRREATALLRMGLTREGFFFSNPPSFNSVDFGNAVSKLRRAASRSTPEPPEHVRFVRIAAEMVEQLRAESSRPITLQIEEREHGELSFVATRHDCPSPTGQGPSDA
jgi:hypothetical protein